MSNDKIFIQLKNKALVEALLYLLFAHLILMSSWYLSIATLFFYFDISYNYHIRYFLSDFSFLLLFITTFLVIYFFSIISRADVGRMSLVLKLECFIEIILFCACCISLCILTLLYFYYKVNYIYILTVAMSCIMLVFLLSHTLFLCFKTWKVRFIFMLSFLLINIAFNNLSAYSNYLSEYTGINYRVFLKVVRGWNTLSKFDFAGNIFSISTIILSIFVIKIDFLSKIRR